MLQYMNYKICEIFKSLQGEGANLGKEVVFIRLSGCNLKCDWCDTFHSNFEIMTELEIKKAVDVLDCKNVIITGGEPTIFNLIPLLDTLKDYWVALETNGTQDISNIRNKIDYIAFSPKGITHKSLKTADEIRVVNEDFDVDDILKFEAYNIKNKYIAVLEKDNYFNLKKTIELLGKVNERVDEKWGLNEQYHKRLKIN